MWKEQLIKETHPQKFKLSFYPQRTKISIDNIFFPRTTMIVQED